MSTFNRIVGFRLRSVPFLAHLDSFYCVGCLRNDKCQWMTFRVTFQFQIISKQLVAFNEAEMLLALL